MLGNGSSLTLLVMQASIRFQGMGYFSRYCQSMKFSEDDLFDYKGWYNAIDVSGR
jgi:hypothetical protein